jgi:deoxyhypusine synthase
MSLDEVLSAAKRVAETEGIREVFVLDRTAGQLEHDVIEHAGDHSFPGKKLDDMDLEDDEKGADMRDRQP